MSEKTNEILVPVPISLLRKASRYDRSMKKILGKFAKENNLPGSSIDHNKESVNKLAEKESKETSKVNNASANKKRS